MLRINSKYKITLLREVRNDDIKTIFYNKKVLYLNNWPDQDWHDFHQIKPIKNYSTDKFSKFFNFFGEESEVLSLTHVANLTNTISCKINNINHIGTSYKSTKFSLLIKFCKSIKWCFLNITRFDMIFVHNFQFPYYEIALIIKYIFKKKIIVDFEDDYYCLNKKTIQSKLFYNIFRHINHPVIAINHNMSKYFNTNSLKFYVFNGFIDLKYASNLKFELKNGMNFLISGTLDIQRGAGVITDIVLALRKVIANFNIYVCGVQVNELHLIHQELNYIGFLDTKKYIELLNSIDVCLVLQLPDHPFNEGSFPSKIENYSSVKKPIYILQLNE